MGNRLSQVARSNEYVADIGFYVKQPGRVKVEVWSELAAAVEGTVSYAPDELARLVAEPSPGPGAPLVEVTAEGSMQAARRLTQEADGRVGVLNFASARNPGGGYLRGAKAQEEDLCRSALLYQCLLAAPDYYAAHRLSGDLRYSHRVIFSPDVPVIRDDAGELLAQPYGVSFLTSPAPNAGQLARSSGGPVELTAVLARRAGRVLAVAARHGVRQLVLGAWGCGVFRNDPAEVAEAFAVALESHGAAFDRVVFAVWDRAAVSVNRTAFERRFGAPAG